MYCKEKERNTSRYIVELLNFLHRGSYDELIRPFTILEFISEMMEA